MADETDEPTAELTDIIGKDKAGQAARRASLPEELRRPATSKRRGVPYGGWTRVGDVLRQTYRLPDGEQREEAYSTRDANGFPVLDSWLAHRRTMGALDRVAVACPACKDAGWLRLEREVGQEGFGQMVRCRCQGALGAEETQRQAIIRTAGFGPPMLARTFQAFVDLAEAAEAKRAALTWALARAEEPDWSAPPWLHLHGEPGSGKTHLAYAAGNALLGRLRPFGFYHVSALVARCKVLIEQGGLYDFLLELQQAPVLILDDLGAARTTEFVILEVLEPMLNHRYAHELPTLLTSIGDAEQLKQGWSESVGRRLQDPAVCRSVHNAAPQWGA